MPEPVTGLPDVAGLTDFLAANQDKDQNQDVSQKQRDEKGRFAAANVGDNGNGGPSETDDQTQKDWAQFANTDGSLNTEALLKSYKEIQGFATKVSQENKKYDETLKQMQEQFELLRMNQAQPQYATQQQPGNDFDSQFIANPQQAVASVVDQRARQMFVQTQIETSLQEEQLKNPTEFQERYNFALQVKNQYPHLAQSPAGVKKLFELGDKLRQEEIKRQSLRAIQAFFGDDVDPEQIRALIKKTSPNPNLNPNLAYMPDSTLSNRTGAETGNQRTYTNEIQSAVAKGDVDSVLKNTFQEILKR